MFFLMVRVDLMGGTVTRCKDQSMVAGGGSREEQEKKKKKKQFVGAGVDLNEQLFSGCLSITVFSIIIFIFCFVLIGVGHVITGLVNRSSRSK